MPELDQRQSSFKRNDEVEKLLGKLASSLETARRSRRPSADTPVLFIVGPPRTGSTYCLELLAASGAFAYPSNFIARYWTAPLIGAMIQDMLVEPAYDFRDEFYDIQAKQVDGISDTGKTRGIVAPNEF